MHIHLAARQSFILQLVIFASLCGINGTNSFAEDPPISIDKELAQKDPNSTIDPALIKIDVPALIHVRTEKDVSRVRKELIKFLWKNDGTLPIRSDLESKNVELPKVFGDYPATCQKLTISMDRGFKSVAFFFQPKKSNHKLGIFHHGHSGDLWGQGGYESVKTMLDRGYSVLAFWMPSFGDNGPFAPEGIHKHNQFEKLITKDFEPLKIFLEPVVVAINYSLDRYKFDDVVMIGLSGGGWTTTVCAAIDPRIRLSFPVAGSYPDFIRKGHAEDIGDWEQYYPEFYKIANYLDLYILGSNGKNREQHQILNQYDTCCFAGIRYQIYESHVQKAVSETGSGTFAVFLDDSHKEHKISKHAIDKVFGPLLSDVDKK